MRADPKRHRPPNFQRTNKLEEGMMKIIPFPKSNPRFVGKPVIEPTELNDRQKELYRQWRLKLIKIKELDRKLPPNRRLPLKLE